MEGNDEGNEMKRKKMDMHCENWRMFHRRRTGEKNRETEEEEEEEEGEEEECEVLRFEFPRTRFTTYFHAKRGVRLRLERSIITKVKPLSLALSFFIFFLLSLNFAECFPLLLIFLLCCVWARGACEFRSVRTIYRCYRVGMPGLLALCHN